MAAKLGLVAPYPELERIAREVCVELGENVDVRQGDLSVGVQAAREMQLEGVEVIVSRGGTALSIAETVDVPVVSIQVTGFDILRALHVARQFGDKIGVVGFKEVIYGTDSIQDILGVPLTLMYIEREQDAEATIRAAVARGIGVVIGDAISARIVERYGAKGVLIESGKEAIVKAIEEAKHVAVVRKRERQRAEEFKTILDFSYEGIVGIDQEGIIRVFNPVAEQFLKCLTLWASASLTCCLVWALTPFVSNANPSWIRSEHCGRCRCEQSSAYHSWRRCCRRCHHVSGCPRIQQTEIRRGSISEPRRPAFADRHKAAAWNGYCSSSEVR